MNVVGLILSGGSGSRLGGVRKGDLRLGGLPLYDRVAVTMRQQCTTLLYSAFQPPRTVQEASDFELIPDAEDAPSGPAAGLFTGAWWCQDNAPDSLMMSVAVDTPFFPDDFVARAQILMTAETACVVGSWGESHYPTVALWRPAPLLSLLSSYPQSPKGPSLREIQRKLSAVSLNYMGLLPNDPFAGVNTLTDLLTLSRRLAEKC